MVQGGSPPQRDPRFTKWCFESMRIAVVAWHTASIILYFALLAGSAILVFTRNNPPWQRSILSSILDIFSLRPALAGMLPAVISDWEILLTIVAIFVILTIARMVVQHNE